MQWPERGLGCDDVEENITYCNRIENETTRERESAIAGRSSHMLCPIFNAC